jgi:hypothetical protein
MTRKLNIRQRDYANITEMTFEGRRVEICATDGRRTTARKLREIADAVSESALTELLRKHREFTNKFRVPPNTARVSPDDYYDMRSDRRSLEAICQDGFYGMKIIHDNRLEDIEVSLVNRDERT